MVYQGTGLSFQLQVQIITGNKIIFRYKGFYNKTINYCIYLIMFFF